MQCLDESKRKIQNGEKLPIKANLNYDSVDYSRLQNKDLYLKLSIKNKSRDLTEWDSNDRKDFFNWIVLEYLNCESAKADCNEE